MCTPAILHDLIDARTVYCECIYDRYQPFKDILHMQELRDINIAIYSIPFPTFCYCIGIKKQKLV